MVNFDQLNSVSKQTLVVEPRQLFQTLQRDRRYEYLRDVQGDVLDEWYERRESKDLVIKMNTGSGKTLVGLLLLWSKLKEGKGPALYLCPNNHLASQVRREADALGISHVEFAEDNLFPTEFSDCTSILITVVHKLFNGKSIFRVADRPSPVRVGSILVDDAHSCVNIARQQFTATLNRESEVGRRIYGLFEGSLKLQSTGIYADIERKQRDAFLQVPYWSWQERLDDVAKILSANSDKPELSFVWPFLRMDEVLANSSVVISGNKVEISPRLLPIEAVPSFNDAGHRVYMSATLMNDAGIVKHFAAHPKAVRKPIRPKVGGDIGERLILIPPLVDRRIEETVTINLVEHIRANHEANVVVLAPSWRGATKWNSVRTIDEKGSNIAATIEQLSSSNSNLAVFVNRYDGIDLPDEACRVLVLDDIPSEHVLANLVEASARQNSPILRRQVAQNIEQGMGRGVRSRSDYCIVVLSGKKLVTFMTDVENQSFFSDETKRQIELGKELTAVLKGKGQITGDDANNAYQSIVGLVQQCLSRDQGWVKYHGQALQNISGTQSPEEMNFELANFELANIELDAWQQAFRGRYDLAANKIGQIFEKGTKLSSGDDEGWYLQMQAQYLHQVDREAALEKQLKAHELNRKLLKPPSGITYKKMQKKTTGQVFRILRWLKQSNDPNALVSRGNLVLDDLVFGVSNESFEQALHALATIIGFESQRPDDETGTGPDVLWRLEDGHYLVIEAKNQVYLERKSIFKNEAAQLGQHVTWFKQEYNDAPYTPVLIHPSATLHKSAYLEANSRIVQNSDLEKIVRSARSFVGALATKPSDQWTELGIANELQAYHLRSSDFLNQYLGRKARQG